MPDKWDEDEDSSTPPSTPPLNAAALAARRKFDDEEDDSDVLDSWDAAEDSEVEREKAKVAAEKKAKADAEAAANKKSKAQRIAERRAEHARRLEDESEDEDEDEASKRERLRRTEQEADLKHAEDLFGDIGISKTRTVKASVVVDSNDPGSAVDLSAMSLFNPQTKIQFQKMRETLVPLLGSNSKKAHYAIFLQEFCKQLAKDLPSDQIKKISSTLTALGNEKMKEEKAAEKGGKKTKAQKTKVGLVAGRNVATAADTSTYDDDFGDDDFM